MSDDLTEDELEAAYLQALEASEAAEASVAEHDAAGQNDERPPEPTVPVAAPPKPSAPPDRVVEAALFTCGEGLSPEKLATLLEIEDGAGRVSAMVASINERYDRQGRPYEVRLRDGVYRTDLRNEFEPVRDRLYGRAPKEVTLSAEVTALLGVIAYEQPVGPERLGKVGVDGWKPALRQLTKRSLVERTEDGYVTTDRFLDVFGLRALDEMPRPEMLEMR